MDNNSASRLHQVFFYGLYMDPAILQQKGVFARQPRVAYAENYQLRIGHKATLLRKAGERAYGMVYALTHAEINDLYHGAGLDDYAAEALMVTIDDQQVAVLCCNLIEPPAADESNEIYQEKLMAAMDSLNLPHTLNH